VTSILNWILAFLLSFGVSIAFVPEAEAMARGIFPAMALLYFSPLVLISVATWLATIRHARKFWRPHFIPLMVIALEYLLLLAINMEWISI
jgi:hypothetical protein